VAKVRAREPWTIAHIGSLVPGLDTTAAIPLRLAPLPAPGAEENSGGD
jgi:hypothetical protein